MNSVTSKFIYSDPDCEYVNKHSYIHINKKNLIRALCVLLIAGAMIAPAIGNQNSGNVTQYDTSRLVVAGGAITETLYALGAEANIVGVDTTSQWPLSAQSLPSIGYLRALSIEGILSLQPSTLLLAADAGPPEVIDLLEQANINIYWFPKTYTFEQVVQNIDVLSQMLNVPERGEKLRQEVHTDFYKIKNVVEKARKKNLTAAFFLSVNDGNATVSGHSTAAHAVLNYAGLANGFESFPGYKPVNTEALVASNPDVVISMAHGGVSLKDATEKALKVPGLEQTTAGKSSKIVMVEPLSTLGFGPRVGKAILKLVENIYKDQE